MATAALHTGSHRTHQYLQGTESYIVTGIGSGIPLYHRQFPDIAALPPGTILEVAIHQGKNHALDWRPSQRHSIAGLIETCTGTLARHAGKDIQLRQPLFA